MATTYPSTASHQLTALVVDDDLMVGQLLSNTLQDMGFATYTADSCEAALKIAKANAAFSVAFIDLELPDGSGLELMSALQRHQPDLRIVIASGYGSMALRDQDYNRGAPPVLCKPYNRETVANLLTELGIPHSL